MVAKMSIIKERVESLREKQGIRSLDELLGRIQVYQPSMAWSSLSQIINNRRSPRLENVEAIARALNTTVAYLIGEVDDPSPTLAASDPLPAVRAWSDRLRALSADQQVKTVRMIESVLEIAEGR